MTAAELSQAKLCNPCHLCKQVGDWADAHNPDGSLKPGSPSFDPQAMKSVGADGTVKPNPNVPAPAVAFMANVVNDTIQPPNTVVCVLSAQPRSSRIGPLVDDGAPFSAIGEVELTFHRKRLVGGASEFLEKPGELRHCSFWQFGVGDHDSPLRRILGSVALHAITDLGKSITIRHIVIEGSSQWIFGRNITRVCNIIHLGRHALQLPCDDPDYLSLIDHDNHSHVSLDRFVPPPDHNLLYAHVGTTVTAAPVLDASDTPGTVDINHNSLHLTPSDAVSSWSSVKRLVDRIHKHVCGHASYSDVRTLLLRNRLWTNQVQHYLVQVFSSCTSCKASAAPPPNRRVSLTSLNRQLNEVVCVDHFHLDNVTLFHVMDTATRLSAAHVVKSTKLEEAVLAFEACWLSQFWTPMAVHGDAAFSKGAFRSMLQHYEI